MPEPAEQNGAFGHTKTVPGRYEQQEAAEKARQALLSRPRFSLRGQVYLGSILAFLFTLGIAVWLVITFHSVEDKIRFLEIVNDYVVKIEVLFEGLP